MTTYIQIDAAPKTLLVHPDFQDEIQEALLDGTGCDPVDDGGGRGGLQRLTYSGGTALLRPYRRGGALRNIRGEGYWFDNRPKHELEVMLHLIERDVSLPLPLGVVWEKHGAKYQGAILSDEVAACDLLIYLMSDGPQKQKENALRACGALIRQMHDAGVYHADLQVRNILASKDACYLIDFDNARIHAHLGNTSRHRNLLRLRRSFEKNARPIEEFQTLCAGYGSETFPAWLDAAYRLKGRYSDLLAGRGSDHANDS